MLKANLPAVYTRCAEPSDSIVWDERRELTVYTRMGRGAWALYHKGISVHWDESRGQPPSLTKCQEPTEIKHSVDDVENSTQNFFNPPTHKSIYTAIAYNDLCIIIYFKQYDISLLHTHTHTHTCISTQIHTVHMYIHM